MAFLLQGEGKDTNIRIAFPLISIKSFAWQKRNTKKHSFGLAQPMQLLGFGKYQNR